MGFGNVAELNVELKRRVTNHGYEMQVGGDGVLSGPIALVGEAPGHKEIEGGQPFIGQSGAVLWKCLREHCGVNRFEVYVTNVMKRQAPIMTKDEKYKVQMPELSAWRDVLEYELEQLPNLKYIVVLGNYALQAIIGEEGIINWRGSVIPHRMRNGRQVTVMAMFNPAHILREPRFQPIFQLDAAKLGRVLRGQYVEHKVIHHINPTFTEAYRWCEKMIDEKKPIAWDIEVMSKETACVGFANNAHEGMCINFRGPTDNRYTIDEEVRLYQKIQQVLAHPDTRLITQNGNFDSYWMWYKDRIRAKPIWFDTMLAHHTLYPILPHNLGFLTSQYTDHPYYKDDGKLWKEQVDKETGVVNKDIDMFWRYNVKDVCITWACHAPLLRELQDQKMDTFFFNHVMKLQPELSKMTVLGVKTDIPLKQKLVEEIGADVEQRRQDIIGQVRSILGEERYKNFCTKKLKTKEKFEDFNPSSNTQMGKLLYDVLQLPVKGKRSVDEDNRKRLIDSPLTPEPVQRMLVCVGEYSTENKFLGTYAESELDDDGRTRCDYKQTGVISAPGRLSSSATLWGSGGNLQNQPERAQKMFIADEGYEFTYTDGSQAEARVVARIAGVRGLLENFERASAEAGFDVHRANAARIFKKGYEEIPSFDRYKLGETTDDPKQDGQITLRYLGKRCVHGLNYRMGPEKLAEVCNISRLQANEAYYSYHRAFPEIKQWWTRTLEHVRRHRELYTPLGRRLLLLGVNPYEDDEALDAIIAFVPQSTIGDWVASLIYKCHHDPDWPRTARFALNIHDALIALNRIDDGPVVRAIMKKHAEQPIMTPQGPVMIPFEFKHSIAGEDGLHRWSHLEKVK